MVGFLSHPSQRRQNTEINYTFLLLNPAYFTTLCDIEIVYLAKILPVILPAHGQSLDVHECNIETLWAGREAST